METAVVSSPFKTGKKSPLQPKQAKKKKQLTKLKSLASGKVPGSPAKHKSRNSRIQKQDTPMPKPSKRMRPKSFFVTSAAPDAENVRNVGGAPQFEPAPKRMRRDPSSEKQRFSSMTSSTSHLLRRNSQQLSHALLNSRNSLSKSFSTKMSASLRNVMVAPNKSGMISPPNRGGNFFHVSLETLLEMQRAVTCMSALCVPILVHDCITALLKHALTVEGIFRLSAPKQVLDEVVRLYETGCPPSMHEMVLHDPHVVTCVLKHFLRSLPIPLLTFDVYDKFIAPNSDVAEKSFRDGVSFDDLKQSIDNLPKAHYDLLKSICYLVRKIAEHSDSTKMNESNLSIVFGPNFTWSRDPGSSQAMDAAGAQRIMKEQIMQNLLAKRIFEDADKIFDQLDQHDMHDAEEAVLVADNGRDMRSPIKSNIKFSTLRRKEHVGKRPALAGLQERLDAAAGAGAVNTAEDVGTMDELIEDCAQPVDETLMEAAQQMPLPESPERRGNAAADGIDFAAATPLPPSPVCERLVGEALRTPLPETPDLRRRAIDAVAVASDTPLPPSPANPRLQNVLLDASETPLPHSPKLS